MWDFIGRTLSTLTRIPPQQSLSDASTPEDRDAWEDVVGRAFLAGELLLDSKPGMLDSLVESTYPEHAANPPIIGDDILAISRKLSRE